MKRDKLDEILQRKLYDAGEEINPAGSWRELEPRLELAERENGIAARSLLRSSAMKYTAAAVVVIFLGLGLYTFRSSDAGTLQDGGNKSLAARAQISVPDFSTDTRPAMPDIEIKGGNTISNLFRSAKSVSIRPSGSVPGGSSVLQAILEAPGPSSKSDLQEKENSLNTGTERRQKRETGSFANYMGQALGVKVVEDLDFFKRLKRSSSWMLSAYTGTLPASQRSGGLGSTRGYNPYESALVESNMALSETETIGKNLSHDLPLSFGFVVRKNLANRFSVETGFTYSYLESSGTLQGTLNYKLKQKAHYLGIPVSVGYSILRKNDFDIYLSAGIMAEKALSVKTFTDLYNGDNFMSTRIDKLQPKGLLWSSNMGLGAGYDLARNFGIYMETGVNYYLPNSDHPETFRTINPWSFNVKAGLRFKF